jgi:uncharacterized protein YlxW (UPF0749 family)
VAKPTAGGAPRHSSVLLSPKSAKIAELNACVDNLQAELNAEKDEKEQLQAEVDSYKARFTDDIEQELQEEAPRTSYLHCYIASIKIIHNPFKLKFLHGQPL